MDSTPPEARGRRIDPRHYQIAILATLLFYGAIWLNFEISIARAAAILGLVLGAQWVCTRLWRLPRFDARSALISGLSLCLLLRTNHGWVVFVAVALTIPPKFFLRVRGKHVFNPTNLGIAATILLTGEAWVSPGQWGNPAFFGFLILCLGGLVVNRAARSDVTYAFLFFYCGLIFARAAWLGDPIHVPLHQLQSGAFLIFTFFMISDPKTTPDSRAGRILFAFLVAFGAGWIRFRMFRPNDLIWSLAALSMLTPLIDLLLPGGRYEWGARPKTKSIGTVTKIIEEAKRKMKSRLIPGATAFWIALLGVQTVAFGFCGFYVARADTTLYNKASKVVLVRNEDKTVITMVSDFQGEMTDFALVVPVPTFLERGQIHVGDMKIVDHLDAYSAPRLVEYFDADPCRQDVRARAGGRGGRGGGARGGQQPVRDVATGVTIEATYTVGEYDIVILSAEQSDGLVTWLTGNGYKIPAGAEDVLGSYIRQNMRFFVARVNLGEQAKLGYQTLRPIQVAFESPKFMLPIRLGTVNANGPQEMFVYVLTRNGRVETTNYRTVRLPTGSDLPVFVKNEFADFYRAMFDEQYKREGGRGIFLEYAWDMGWCDPCAADPLSRDELRQLGVFWLDEGGPTPTRGRSGRGVVQPGGAQNVFITRLHVRYDRDRFPEDLFFQETADRANFQGRYVLRHPYRGELDDCPAARTYYERLRQRQEEEARTLANLTGWDINEIRRKMGAGETTTEDTGTSGPLKWWQKIWKGGIGLLSASD
jgi:hypothetical protein